MGEEPLVQYSFPEDGDAVFARVCPKCGRFVKADEKAWKPSEYLKDKLNGTCSRCGRIEMPFLGWF